MMNIFKLAAAILVATAVGAAAQTTTAPAGAAPTTGTALAIPQLIERLSREGHSDVNEISRKSDKLYKVSARDAKGRNVEMYVDARTAEVLASEEED